MFGLWHQDSTSFDLVQNGGVSAWIPLNDIDSDTGGSLSVISKSDANHPLCPSMKVLCAKPP